VFNLTATHLRDRYLVGDGEHTIARTMARLDREILAQHRALTPVGGSDSHSEHLRGATYVLAESRTGRGIRDAIAAGRTCVRDPDACSLEARGAGEWSPVGSHLPAGKLEVRAHGDDIEIFANGKTLARPQSGESFSIEAKGCTVIRARVGKGYSAPIYSGC
jgi:hypothetical protein